MTKWLIWLPPIALLTVALAFGGLWRQSGFLSSQSIAYESIPFFAYALISLLLDLAWRTTTRSWPTYKRHLAIFGLLALPVAYTWWFFQRTFGSPGSENEWLISAIGIISGLCLSCLPFVFGSRNTAYGWRRGSNKRRDISRQLVIVADPHWGEEFTGLQEAALAMHDADWLFLGDVFDVWVGVRGFETDAQRNFLWWVSERRRIGCWVGLWLGNREYFLDEIAEKFDFIGEGVHGGLEGEQLAFEHGDLINTKDLQYRFWNLLSRSGLLWIFAKLIPSFIGKKIVALLEKKLQTTNQEHKIIFPKDEFQRAALESGAGLFITGHFHTYEEVEKGASVPWAHGGKLTLWQNGELKVIK